MKRTKPVWRQSKVVHKPSYPLAIVRFPDGKSFQGDAVKITETHITIKRGGKYYTLPRYQVELFNYPSEGGE